MIYSATVSLTRNVVRYAETAMQVVIAPFGRVGFAENLLGDIFTSLTACWTEVYHALSSLLVPGMELNLTVIHVTKALP